MSGADSFLSWSFRIIGQGVKAAVLVVALVVIGIPVLMIAAHTIIPVLVLLFPVWLVRKYGPLLVIKFVRVCRSITPNRENSG
ncbi:hypothetical protein GS429_20645 [Natronorubrum sp. JWXQ-INN-674]|uniref:Uncharacterized protein n=1 Tax=Natronorubrum halalkaliphilum TaxID=2691917 RepID=A0A6B0VUL9_9EURY|nr:hypothetical protein [Natronorubrum halalkaliphilum]MXV64432.1 hypothetical protein [Natronorubrum halalkaliphilum]